MEFLSVHASTKSKRVTQRQNIGNGLVSWSRVCVFELITPASKPVLQDCLEGLPFDALKACLEGSGVNPVHAKALFNAVHRRLEQPLAEGIGRLLPPLQRWLASADALPLCTLNPVNETASADGFTHKYLLQLADGAEVEAVQMGFPGRFTAGLSSQVGCAMGCVFARPNKWDLPATCRQVRSWRKRYMLSGNCVPHAGNACGTSS